MTSSTRFSTINLKLIGLHLVAGWFLMTGFYTISFLTNIPFAEEFKTITPFSEGAWWGQAPNSFVSTIIISGFAGLITSFIISLSICIRKKWFWLNAVIVLILSLLLVKFYWILWNTVKPFAWFAGEKFNNIFLEFLIKGIILLFIGLFIFFSKWTNHFIQKKRVKEF